MLSRLIFHKVDKGLIRGLKVSRCALAIHRLLFTDDIFMLGKASTCECSQFRECLDIFCNWSGQSFNVQKSSIFLAKILDLQLLVFSLVLWVSHESLYKATILVFLFSDLTG